MKTRIKFYNNVGNDLCTKKRVVGSSMFNKRSLVKKKKKKRKDPSFVNMTINKIEFSKFERYLLSHIINTNIINRILHFQIPLEN